MENIYLCPRCGEPMRTLRLACWLRLVESKSNDDTLHFFCRSCAQPLVIPRDAPLAVA